MSTDRQVKPRSRGMINPTQEEMIPRHFGRIRTLKLAIKKSTERGNTEKVASLQAELDRRLADLAETKAQMEGN